MVLDLILSSVFFLVAGVILGWHFGAKRSMKLAVPRAIKSTLDQLQRHADCMGMGEKFNELSRAAINLKALEEDCK